MAVLYFFHSAIELVYKWRTDIGVTCIVCCEGLLYLSPQHKAGVNQLFPEETQVMETLAIIYLII